MEGKGQFFVNVVWIFYNSVETAHEKEENKKIYPLSSKEMAKALCKCLTIQGAFCGILLLFEFSIIL